ncbi:hypothetical protein I553_5196 [Mycobacterium xenopi 4042]|uniref:Uncharacterized protein n=1 Tax=Mycobacterium xenopi 4042 TaxID=1299334 RepID=X7ZVW1_MYCXE|nr:hypothetical protein I553_5196 [Mycobacterium xenopi 4042]
MRTATEAPVPVHLPIHHEVVGRYPSLPSRLIAPRQSRTGVPSGSMAPPTVIGCVVTRGTTGAGGSSRTISSTNTGTCSGCRSSVIRSFGSRAKADNAKPIAAVTVSSPPTQTNSSTR